MKKTLISLCAFLFAIGIFAQTPQLKFNENGEFKILQFTDIHYRQGDPKANNTPNLLLAEALDAEKPDLVVFTGDIVYAKPAFPALDEVFAYVVERKIPFAYILGNHDDEFEKTREEMINHAMTKPYNLTIPGDKNLFGVGNYILEVKSKDANKNAAILYLFDSGSYSQLEGQNGYDWLKLNQINWYAKESESYTKENGGEPYPALAFMHIPLPEYEYMVRGENPNIIGNKTETECNPKINSGMYTAMREAKDVMGVFSGHDHDNDYIGDYGGIALAYGRYSGGNTVYNHLGLNGCRVINLKEGEKSFSTYIYLRGGEKLFNVDYPADFQKKEDPKK